MGNTFEVDRETLRVLKTGGPALAGCYVRLLAEADARGMVSAGLRKLADIMGYSRPESAQEALTELSSRSVINFETGPQGTSVKILNFRGQNSVLKNSTPAAAAPPLDNPPDMCVKNINKPLKKEGVKGGKARQKFTPYFDFILDPAFRELWREWADFRAELGKPFKTEKGYTKQYSLLLNLSGGDIGRARAVVDYSIEREYHGLFPLKNYAPANKPAPSAPPDWKAEEKRRQAALREIRGAK